MMKNKKIQKSMYLVKDQKELLLMMLFIHLNIITNKYTIHHFQQ